jgi:hypothetical protein
MKKTILILIISLFCLFNFSTAFGNTLMEGELESCFRISNISDFPDYWFVPEEFEEEVLNWRRVVKDDSCFNTIGKTYLYAFKKDLFEENFFDKMGWLKDVNPSTSKYDYPLKLQSNITKSNLTLEKLTVEKPLAKFTVNIVIDSLSENEFIAHIGEIEKVELEESNPLILLGISIFAFLIIIVKTIASFIFP